MFCCGTPLHARYPTHSGLTPAAPDERAFVHRKSRNSAGKRARRNAQERGA